MPKTSKNIQDYMNELQEDEKYEAIQRSDKYIEEKQKKWYSEEELIKAIEETLLDGVDPTYVNDLKKKLGLKR